MSPTLTRRAMMASTAGTALTAACAHNAAPAAETANVRSLPLSAVRLTPSPYQRALDANLGYLHSLEPDRLLHNFRVYAGLEPKGDVYGGWESDTIAGHTLGHYLSACALMHAQTGDPECLRRALYIIDELDACQQAGGDGYVAGFTRKNAAGVIESGRRIFEEISQGDIRPARFYINGSWAPFYTWHKLYAGLLDAHAHCGAERALTIASQLSAYIESKLAPLDEAQMQAVLSTEFGGMPDVLAELSARANEPRWLALAQRFHHRAVLDPLIEGRDALSHLHANTQIPKFIGLDRIGEATGDQSQRNGARNFWRAVTNGRTYVIGGNSDREYFQEPNSISRYITEQTCESCNTYNMLKLTRRLYAREPNAAYFDYFERAHLNHIMAHQRPTDGMFAYMVPLMSGAARGFSQPFGNFWCCVGTGMESHAKHGESIFWQRAGALYVNLYIASELTWAERNAEIALETAYPFQEEATLRIKSLARPQRFEIALRAPAWCAAPALELNGAPLAAAPDGEGYLRVERVWRAGDALRLRLPMSPRFEATPDDANTVALLRGPMVLAADLGPADAPFEGPAPALVSDDALAALEVTDPARAIAQLRGASQPSDLTFAPFYSQHDRRVAVYFKRYTPSEWAQAQTEDAREQARIAALNARSSDVIVLGDPDSERAHNLTSEISYALSYRTRPGRDARTGGYFAFDAAVRPGPLALQATYWGGERDRVFHIEVDGARIATQRLQGEHSGEFITRDYLIPPALLRGKTRVRVRFTPETGHSAGPAFGCRLYRP